MEKTYIFGHRNPDTDSVTSAISLSYLKNKQGMNTIPAVLSSINLESKFVLNYFNIEEPIFLNDVNIKIKDLKFRDLRETQFNRSRTREDVYHNVEFFTIFINFMNNTCKIDKRSINNFHTVTRQVRNLNLNGFNL